MKLNVIKKRLFNFCFDAANAGHEKAIFNLGVAYLRGHGVDANREEAVKLFKLAADKGVKEAIESLKSLGIKDENSCSIY